MNEEIIKMVLDEKLRDVCPFTAVDSKGRWYVMRCEGDAFPIVFVADEAAGNARVAELKGDKA